MATITRIEEIQAWRKARELARAIYQLMGSAAFARELKLRDQMRSAAVSVTSNIAEGFGRVGLPSSDSSSR